MDLSVTMNVIDSSSSLSPWSEVMLLRSNATMAFLVEEPPSTVDSHFSSPREPTPSLHEQSYCAFSCRHWNPKLRFSATRKPFSSSSSSNSSTCSLLQCQNLLAIFHESELKIRLCTSYTLAFHSPTLFVFSYHLQFVLPTSFAFVSTIPRITELSNVVGIRWNNLEYEGNKRRSPCRIHTCGGGRR
ncbi:hypothetical protein HN51_055804 [Arachis hypogaea]